MLPGVDQEAPGFPGERAGHTAVWTGREMLIWGGGTTGGMVSTGSIFDPLTGRWSPMSRSTMTGRAGHTAIWTGDQMLVWGNPNSGDPSPDGARYSRAMDAWSIITSQDGPLRRTGHSAVWTDREMLIWGGQASATGDILGDGGRYDPVVDRWLTLSEDGVPSARRSHTAIWTGREMIIWGGSCGGECVLNNGARYDPSTNVWSPMSLVGAPAARAAHTAVWTGREMLIWGGRCGTDCALSDGGRYDPRTDSWLPIASTDGNPSPRSGHTAVWSGREMFISGGSPPSSPDPLGDGGRYDPLVDTWSPLPSENAPFPRFQHTAVWTGWGMIIWGGSPGGQRSRLIQTGAVYMPYLGLPHADASGR